MDGISGHSSLSELDSKPIRGSKIPVAAWFGLIAGIVFQGISYALIGVNAGLFFAAIVWVTLLLPPMVLTVDCGVRRVVAAGGIVFGIAGVCLIGVFTSNLTFLQWLECCVVLVACGMALLGIVSMLFHIFSEVPEIASAVTVMIALAWLTSPVWLARMMPDYPNATHQLVRVHPLFAVNGVTLQFGLWTERPIAYRSLLTLGQDVPTGLPETVWPAVLFHGLIGCAGLGIAAIVPKRRPGRS